MTIREKVDTTHIKNMRSRVFKHMLKTRGWKYRAFLRYLRFFKYASFAPIRGAFLESYYVLMRYLDDIVDGDAPLPNNYSSESEYIIEKMIFSKNPESPKDEVDYLMLYCFELADKFGENFQEETNDILSSLHFDAERRGKLIVFPKDELIHHFHKLDIKGTIKATLKIFKDDSDMFEVLAPLGLACRYQYDLEDFEADIKAGYINISKEDCVAFDLSIDDLHLANSPKVKQWFRHRAKEGLNLLMEHHQRLPKGEFSLLARATFPLVYELPARKLFRRIISETERSNSEENE